MDRRTRGAAVAAAANMAALNLTGVPDARYPDADVEFTGMYKCVCADSDSGLCDAQRRDHMFGHVTIGLPTDRDKAQLQLESLYKNRLTSRQARTIRINQILDENDAAGSQCRRIAYIHYRPVDRKGSATARLTLAELTSEQKDQRRIPSAERVPGDPRR